MPTASEKLFQKAKINQNGWKRQEIDRLYLGFGFIIRFGRNHDIVSHPDYPKLRETLPRHVKIKPVYVRKAVKLISCLLDQQENDQDG